LAARGNDCYLIVLAQFIFDELSKHLSSSGEAPDVEVEIIQVEEDGPTTVEGHRATRKRWRCIDTATGRGELRFFVTPGFD